MNGQNIAVGMAAFTIGDLLGFDGQRINAPVSRYGWLSVITGKWWYHNPQTKRIEQAYKLELSTALELGGAPVFAYGTVISTMPFRYQQVQPFVLGVVKDFQVESLKDELISPRAAILEPGMNLKALIDQLAKKLYDSEVDNATISQNVSEIA